MVSGTIEQRVEGLELELANVAHVIDLEGRLNKTRFEAVFADLDVVKRRLDQLAGCVDQLTGRVDQLTDRVEDLPSAVARTVVELLATRDKGA